MPILCVCSVYKWDPWALWPDSILSSVKIHENTLGICKNAPKGPLDSEKQNYLVWWTSILSIIFEGNQLCSSPAQYHPKSKVCWCVFFSGRDWGTRHSKKSSMTMTLCTQQEWLIYNSVNVHEWPSHSQSLNPIKYFWRNLKMCVCPHPTWQSLRGEE